MTFKLGDRVITPLGDIGTVGGVTDLNVKVILDYPTVYTSNGFLEILNHWWPSHNIKLFTFPAEPEGFMELFL